MIVCQNGNYCEEEELEIQCWNRSFLYGDGLFESMRFYKGELLLADRHFERLQSSTKILELRLPHEISNFKKFVQLVKTLAAKNNCDNARVKLILYRNAGGRYATKEESASFIVQLEKMQTPAYQLQKRGLQIDVYRENKKGLGSLSAIKSTSALLFVMAGKFAIKNGIDEALVLNSNDELCEGISSNLFLIKNDEIVTPSIQSACLPGVMRSLLIDICRRSSWKLTEKLLHVSDLDDCDEMFMTNAISGIQWVGGYQNKRFYSKKTRELHKLLMKTLT